MNEKIRSITLSEEDLVGLKSLYDFLSDVKAMPDAENYGIERALIGEIIDTFNHERRSEPR